jgi:hypothetical protein
MPALKCPTRLTNSIAILIQRRYVPAQRGVRRQSTAEGVVNEFQIKLARIEVVSRSGTDEEADEEVCMTFRFKRAPISFEVPIFLHRHHFDDTEMVKVARNMLHQTFAQLAEQCDAWQLTNAELRELGTMNSRPI